MLPLFPSRFVTKMVVIMLCITPISATWLIKK